MSDTTKRNEFYVLARAARQLMRRLEEVDPNGRLYLDGDGPGPDYGRLGSAVRVVEGACEQLPEQRREETEPSPANLTVAARAVVTAAERDLGRLPGVQLADLLLDRLPEIRDAAHAREIVRSIGRDPQERDQ